MVELFDHQKEALGKLKTGSILWGGVGSGKSITAIAYYYILECKKMGEPKDLYIITTARKRDTGEWEGELARFGLRVNADRVRHEEGKGYFATDKRKTPDGKPFDNQKDILICVDSWNNISKYADDKPIENAFFIFDEQRVVGYGTWTKSFLKITKRNHWILLSATPGDCWMDYMPVFIANGFYKNKTEFQFDHVKYNRYNTKYPQISGYMNEKILQKHRDDILVGMSFERSTEQHHIYFNTEWNKELYDSVMRNRWNPYTQEPIAEISELCFHA